MRRSTFTRLATVVSLLGLAASACAEPDDGGSNDGPTPCIGGQYCVGNLVCIGGFCLDTSTGNEETGDGDPTGDGDGDPTGDGDGDPTGDGDGDGDPSGDGDGDPTGDGDGDPWGGAPTPANLWPLVVGATWTFQVNPGTGCNGGDTQIWELTGMAQHLGHFAYIRTTCGSVQSHLRVTGGDLYVSHSDNPWFLLLKAPVTDGAMWMDNGTTHEWVDAGTLNTPAGSLESCWTNVYNASEAQETFCQGVGPVEVYGLGTLIDYSIP